jgi:hypothetical protein
MLSRVHEPIVLSTVKPLYENAKELPESLEIFGILKIILFFVSIDNFWWRQFIVALGNGLKEITRKKKSGQNEAEITSKNEAEIPSYWTEMPGHNKAQMAQNIERKVHRPLRETLKAFLDSENIPEGTPTSLRLIMI